MIQSTYLTIGWRQREKRVCQIQLEESGRCGTYVHKFSLKNTYGTRKLKPRIDHKIYSTKGSKRDVAKTTKKNRLEVVGNSLIVEDEMVIVTWDHDVNSGDGDGKLVINPCSRLLGWSHDLKSRVRARCRNKLGTGSQRRHQCL